MKIECKTRRRIVAKKPQNIVHSTTLLRRMLFTSSATFVGAFAGVCTQMYACALRKVPLFHRECCLSSSSFNSSSLSSSSHRLVSVASRNHVSLSNLSRASPSLSLLCA